MVIVGLNMIMRKIKRIVKLTIAKIKSLSISITPFVGMNAYEKKILLGIIGKFSKGIKQA